MGHVPAHQCLACFLGRLRVARRGGIDDDGFSQLAPTYQDACLRRRSTAAARYLFAERIRTPYMCTNELPESRDLRRGDGPRCLF